MCVDRELFLQEKSQLRVEVEQLEHELALCRATLAKEQEWKSQMETNHRMLLTEKRDLLTELVQGLKRFYISSIRKQL